MVIDEKLQAAYDEMMCCVAEPGSEEYRRTWRNYLAAGGTLDLRPRNVDLDNWQWCRAGGTGGVAQGIA
jgi:hypothetical protein